MRGRCPEATDKVEETVFRAERLHPDAATRARTLPPLLNRARRLEKGMRHQSRQEVFLRQARLLADYEDDFAYHGDPVRYFPTYQSLSDDELRGYFAWRARMRRGEMPADSSRTFILLYIYELLNSIGVESPEAGHALLGELRARPGIAGTWIEGALDRWLADHVIYYNLDRSLLPEGLRDQREQALATLGAVQFAPREKVLEAVKRLAPGWLGRSRFYAAFPEEMDELVHRVLRGMSAHYAKGCRKNLVEQYFGVLESRPMHLFSEAVFCDPLKRRNYEYVVNSELTYRCENGSWQKLGRMAPPRGLRKFEKLLKTIDSVLREEQGYPHPVRPELSTMWILRLIREEARALLAEKAMREKKRIHIDAASLDRIREDAAQTRERLMVEGEELEEEAPPPEPQRAPGPGEELLAGPERRLLRCLIYGGSLDWIREEGLMLSVLVDAINEKLYDRFGDSVLDETPQVLEDYTDELKEMIRP